MSSYTIVLCKFTHVVAKKELGSQQRQLEKPVVTTGAYIVSMDRKITVYRLETCKTTVLRNVYKLSIATCSRILLACL